MDFLKRFASSSDFFGMKKSLLHSLIAGAVLAGMAGCAQVKKPVRRSRRRRSVRVSIGSDGLRCMPASRARRKSCSISVAQDQPFGLGRLGMKRKSSPMRRRKTGVSIFRENGDVADNQTVATLKSRARS